MTYTAAGKKMTKYLNFNNEHTDTKRSRSTSTTSTPPTTPRSHRASTTSNTTTATTSSSASDILDIYTTLTTAESECKSKSQNTSKPRASPPRKLQKRKRDFLWNTSFWNPSHEGSPKGPRVRAKSLSEGHMHPEVAEERMRRFERGG